MLGKSWRVIFKYESDHRETRDDKEDEYHLSLWSLIVVNNAPEMTNP